MDPQVAGWLVGGREIEMDFGWTTFGKVAVWMGSDGRTTA